MDHWRFEDMASRRFRASRARDHSLGQRVLVPALDDGPRGAHVAEDDVCDVGVLPVLVRATEEECNHRPPVTMILFSSAPGTVVLMCLITGTASSIALARVKASY
jgi:hypothetical protein